MRCIKIRTAFVASLLISVCPVSAQIPVSRGVVVPCLEEDDTVMVSKICLSKTIEQCALAASAAYNDRTFVSQYSTPIRKQVGYPDREMLTQTHEVMTFPASIPGQKSPPAGLIAYQHDQIKDKHKIILSFHGTESYADLLTDLWANKIHGQDLNINGYVHGGFYARYQQSRKKILDVIQEVLEAHKIQANDVEISVTGHSLGAALATIAAADLKNQYSNIELVTFNSPRVVDHQGAADIENKLEGRITRIWRKNDPISMVSIGTRLLGFLTGFKHVGVSTCLAAEKGFWPISMANHSLAHMIRDAQSTAPVHVIKHVGFWDRMKDNLNAVKKTLITAKDSFFKRFW